MAAEQIAQNLSYINWTLLTSLAVGAFWAVAFGRLTTLATKGYLAFIAFTAAGFAALAALSDGALPVMDAGSGAYSGPILPASASSAGLREAVLWALAVIALVYAVVLLRGARAPLLAAAGTVAGIAVLFIAAGTWYDDAKGNGGMLAFLAQLVVLAAATGGVWASMILGHWYLVTPKLPEGPLVRFARLLTAVVVAQIVLFGVWQLAGAGPAGQPSFGALGGQWALFVWLRLVVGLVMSLVISWAAIQTAKTRSMESATGLLYIDVGLVAAGTILAAGLYFGAGVLA